MQAGAAAAVQAGEAERELGPIGKVFFLLNEVGVLNQKTEEKDKVGYKVPFRDLSLINAITQ